MSWPKNDRKYSFRVCFRWSINGGEHDITISNICNWVKLTRPISTISKYASQIEFIRRFSNRSLSDDGNILMKNKFGSNSKPGTIVTNYIRILKSV